MAYFENTLTGSQTGLTVMADIKAELDGNLPTGWSFVETYTESSTTWDVYKCAAAQSGLSNDFHVVFVDTETGTSSLKVFVCEGYDATNHRMIRPHLNYTAGDTTPPTGGSDGSGDDSTLYRPTTSTPTRTAGTGLSSNFSHALNATVSSVTDWAIFVYADAMVLSFKAGSVGSGFYAGALQSLVNNNSTNDPMPVVLLNLHNFVSASTNFEPGSTATRVAGGPIRSAMNANVAHRPSLIASVWHVLTGINFITDITNPDNWDKYAASSGGYALPYMVTRASSASTYASSGLLRGKLPYIVAAGGGSWGDTVEVGPDTYQRITSSNTIWALRDDL
jgi:hypothetical protein